MMNRSARTGLTLLEIVLALAIFGGSMVALSQLASNGARAAVQGRLKTQATIRCEAKLNEVLAGIVPMQSTSGMPFPDSAAWTWSMVVTPSSHQALVQLDVIVSHQGSSRLSNTSVALRRWAREQVIFVQAVEQVKEETEAKANHQ